MIVISQNKKKLINFNQVSEIQIQNKTKIEVVFAVDSARDCIAEYSTEEKAMKVLRWLYIACSKRDTKSFIMPQDADVDETEKLEQYQEEERLLLLQN